MQGKQSIRELADRLEGPFKHLVLGQIDGYCAYLVRIEGKYLFHQHPKDEMYLVLDGAMTVDYADGSTVVLDQHEALTVEAGVKHRSRSDDGALVLMVKARDLFAE